MVNNIQKINLFLNSLMVQWHKNHCKQSNSNFNSTFLPNIKEIKIGRMSDCDIKINDSGLSRY